MVTDTKNTPRDKEKEKRQDLEFNRRREIFDNYFNRNYNYSNKDSDNSYLENTTNYKPFKGYDEDDYSDPLEKTSEIDNVGIEELKKLVAQLKELNYDEKEDNDKGQSRSSGKVLTKVAPGYRKSSTEDAKQTPSNDNKEIGTSFMYCFILSLVTAIIGTGWLLNIINHL